MFTGIIEQLGRVTAVEEGPGKTRLTVDAGPLAAGVRLGDSVALNGVCLTAVAVEPPRLAFEAIPETLRRSNLGDLQPGQPVNLERPLVAGGRLDGHFVQGHVDGVGEVAAVTPEGDSRRVTVRLPAPLRRYVVEKGSIAVDGVSLTVAGTGAETFEVALIPHTLALTTLGHRQAGDRVNLEVDILAKYVERLMETQTDNRPSS